jgi:glycosyltransferase involved in cell wall biosynthesis
LKILLINHYAGSTSHGMEYRPYYLAREWINAGHEVKIVSSSFSHLRIKNPELDKSDVLVETISGVEFTWLAVPHYFGNGIKRIINIFMFIYRLFKYGKSIASKFKPDVVIASSTYPMDIWPASRIAKLSDAKLVFEIHDLWPLTPIELGGYSAKHPYIRLVQSAENFAYRNSDYVVSILPNVKSHVLAHGLAEEKLHIVPNGIVTEEWEVVDDPDEKIGHIEKKIIELKHRGYFVVGYAGSHGIPNALNYLVMAAEIIKHKEVAVILVGNGSEKDSLKKSVENLALDGVYFFDFIEKKFVPRLLSLFDVGYIGWRKQPLYRFGISPNKIMDYMMAGLPILHSVEAGNDPCAECGCGMTVPPEDPTAIAEAILAFQVMSKADRAKMGSQGRDYVLQNHTYPVLASKFLAAMS